MLLPRLGSAGSFGLQLELEGRGSVSPAYSFSGLQSFPSIDPPEIPRLPGHTLYMVTPGGSEGISRTDAIGDLIHLSSWLVAAISVTPDHRKHLHYIALLPNSRTAWLDRHPYIYRRYERQPHVIYSRDGTVEACDLVFSSKNRPERIKNYLTGPKNRATFVTLLDISPTPARRPVLDIVYIFNHLQPHTSGLLDDLDGRPWERDAAAAQKAAKARSVTVDRPDGEKKIARPETTKGPLSRPLNFLNCKKEIAPDYVPRPSGYI